MAIAIAIATGEPSSRPASALPRRGLDDQPRVAVEHLARTCRPRAATRCSRFGRRPCTRPRRRPEQRLGASSSPANTTPPARAIASAASAAVASASGPEAGKGRDDLEPVAVGEDSPRASWEVTSSRSSGGIAARLRRELAIQVARARLGVPSARVGGRPSAWLGIGVRRARRRAREAPRQPGSGPSTRAGRHRPSSQLLVDPPRVSVEAAPVRCRSSTSSSGMRGFEAGADCRSSRSASSSRWRSSALSWKSCGLEPSGSPARPRRPGPARLARRCRRGFPSWRAPPAGRSRPVVGAAGDERETLQCAENDNRYHLASRGNDNHSTAACTLGRWPGPPNGRSSRTPPSTRPAIAAAGRARR